MNLSVDVPDVCFLRGGGKGRRSLSLSQAGGVAGDYWKVEGGVGLMRRVAGRVSEGGGATHRFRG